jgi:hypothetical protein
MKRCSRTACSCGKLVPMIPDTAAKYFWDVNASELNVEKHKRLIMSRLLNYGDLREWRWLAERYGKKEIVSFVRSDGRTGLREPTKRLALVMFG